jgi:hypothetical protein
MWTRTETRTASATPALALAFASLCATAGLCGPARAADGVATAPAQMLVDVAALKSAFVSRIGRPVYVLDVQLNQYSASLLVQDQRDHDMFDKFEAVFGKPLAEGQPVKVGDVRCKKQKIALSDLDFAPATRLLARARDLGAAIGGYDVPGAVSLDADPFCKEFGWHVYLSGKDETHEGIDLFTKTDGSAGTTQRMHNDGSWERLDADALIAGKAKLALAAPKAAPSHTAGDGRERNYYREVVAELDRLQAQIGAPLALQHIGIYEDSLSVDVYSTKNRKRMMRYSFDAEGAIRGEEQETPDTDCKKPFSTSDFVLDRLPDLIAGAPAQIPPLARGTVHSVHIQRGIVDCDAPYISIDIEDERADGNVEYSARGKLRHAEVK